MVLGFRVLGSMVIPSNVGSQAVNLDLNQVSWSSASGVGFWGHIPSNVGSRAVNLDLPDV